MLNLLNFKRNNHTDLSFFGSIFHFNKSGLINGIGDSSAPIFLRSLAKPIQASLLLDFADNFNEEEIAVFCSSHTAQDYHLKTIRGVLERFGLSENNLKCGIHPPFAPRNDSENTQIHNNCSGKHTLMLALCILNNWNIENYLSPEHPLQKRILQRHIELSGCGNLIPSLDGCGAPIYALSPENIARAFFNLDKKITNSMRNHPKLAGGDGRVDTKIMECSTQLVSKLGAGGLLLVLNGDECLIIKLAQDNNHEREVVASTALNQLKWINKPLCDYDGGNLHDDKVGEYRANFNLVN